MAGTGADLFVNRSKRMASFAVRHEIGAFREAAAVRLTADGGSAQILSLSDDAWHTVNVVLRPRDTPWIGGMHRVRIELDHAWVPASIIPGSSDTRTLGLQIGVVDLR